MFHQPYDSRREHDTNKEIKLRAQAFNLSVGQGQGEVLGLDKQRTFLSEVRNLISSSISNFVLLSIVYQNLEIMWCQEIK